MRGATGCVQVRARAISRSRRTRRRSCPRGRGATSSRSAASPATNPTSSRSSDCRAPGWGRSVDKMVRWGATVEADEREPMLDYLAAHFAPKPVAQRTSSPPPAAKRSTSALPHLPRGRHHRAAAPVARRLAAIGREDDALGRRRPRRRKGTRSSTTSPRVIRRDNLNARVPRWLLPLLSSSSSSPAPAPSSIR